MDAAELKKLWEVSVQRLLQSPDYRASKHWNEMFQNLAVFFMGNPEINVQRFVEANIKHMMNAGLVEKMFPNCLSGEGALARYLTAPQDASVESDVLFSLRTQGECFAAVCKNMGEDFAFESTVTEYTPLFMSYMRWVTKRPIPEVLRGNARTELCHKPMARQFFPAEFLEFLA
jgi:hypothetical protein